MPSRPDTSDYRRLLQTHAPLLDLRAPAEFARGAFPHAHNLPLMSDAERAQVGTCYKQQGQAAAISLGHDLVSGDTRAQRLEGWLAFAQAHPHGYLYCFRGGLRSQIVQQWLAAEGVPYPRVIGGYKALRHAALQVLDEMAHAAPIILVAGRTGSGKTRLLSALPGSVDLEALARHRGSAFGRLLVPQPSQIDFEHALTAAVLQRDPVAGPVWLEDESRLIGRVALPEALRERMRHAAYVELEVALEDRIQVVLEDYVLDLGQRFRAAYAEQGAEQHQARLQEDLTRIRNRLGGALQQSIAAQMAAAFAEQATSGSLAGHRLWIGRLLSEYYDPLYDHHLQGRLGQRLYRGSADDIRAWARAYRVSPWTP